MRVGAWKEKRGRRPGKASGIGEACNEEEQGAEPRTHIRAQIHQSLGPAATSGGSGIGEACYSYHTHALAARVGWHRGAAVRVLYTRGTLGSTGECLGCTGVWLGYTGV